MADIVGYISPLLLVDTDSGRRLVNTEAQVFAMTDTGLTSPLTITDLQGVPITGGTLVSNGDGVLPSFRPPSGVVEVLIRAGSALTPATDISLYAAASVTAASNAAQDATDAASARRGAEAARADAVAAADVLRELAQQQGAPLAPNPNRPGTFIILNPAALVEDPARPGTFKNGVTA